MAARVCSDSTSCSALASHSLFTPTPGFTGLASLQIETDDLGNTGSGGFKTDDDTVLIFVSNDAPVLDDSVAMFLTDITEDDTNPAGDTVAQIILSAGGDRITDPNLSPLEGVAVFGVDDTNGQWQYDAGAGWTAFGALSQTSAVLLNEGASIRFVPNADYNGGAGDISFRAWDQTSGRNGDTGADASNTGGATAYSIVSTTATLNVINAQDAPTIVQLAGDGLSYSAGDGSRVIEQSGDAVLSDVDSPDFDGGNLTVAIVAGVDITEDELSIRDEGAGAGQIGFDGVNVTYEGTLIGTASGGGAGGADLVITFNASADAAAVSALVRNITYENTDLASANAGARTIRFTADDGDGGISANYDTTVTVFSPNRAPTITNLAGDVLAYDEGDGAQVIAQGDDEVVADTDSADFDGGDLTVSVAGGGVVAEDILSIRHQGMGGSQIGFSGGDVFYGGVKIGSATGGSGGVDLVISLNASATPMAVTALAKNITYENLETDNPTVGDRIVRFGVSDGDGAFSSTSDATITVGLINDAPVFDIAGTMTLTNIFEDDTDPAGDIVTSIIASAGGDRITDVDDGAVEGIAVTGVVDTNGQWQFDIGGGWTAFGGVSDASAVLLDGSASIRFVPASDYYGRLRSAVTARRPL